MANKHRRKERARYETLHRALDLDGFFETTLATQNVHGISKFMYEYLYSFGSPQTVPREKVKLNYI
jgi:hypothetical protein